MNITDLEKSGYVSDEPEKRTIKWDGQAGEVFVRRLSFAAVTELQTKPERMFKMDLVRECIRLGDGSEELTPEQVAKLKPSLADALMTAIVEVNGLGKEPDPNG